jgi:UDP-2-acetamido-2-deoxy-ribo-hexuluronate aminotransferase
VIHQYTIRTPEREALRMHLEYLGIGSGIYYHLPLHLQPCFRHLGHGEGSFPVAEAASREVLSLPVHSYLSQEEMESVVEGIRSFYL